MRVHKDATASFDYSFALSNFSNPDSFASEKRKNRLHTLSARLNYQVDRRMWLYAIYSFQKNISKFTSNIVLNAEDINDLRQDTTLISYQRNQLVMGLRMDF